MAAALPMIHLRVQATQDTFDMPLTSGLSGSMIRHFLYRRNVAQFPMDRTMISIQGAPVSYNTLHGGETLDVEVLPPSYRPDVERILHHGMAHTFPFVRFLTLELSRADFVQLKEDIADPVLTIYQHIITEQFGCSLEEENEKKTPHRVLDDALRIQGLTVRGVHLLSFLWDYATGNAIYDAAFPRQFAMMSRYVQEERPARPFIRENDDMKENLVRIPQDHPSIDNENRVRHGIRTSIIDRWREF